MEATRSRAPSNAPFDKEGLLRQVREGDLLAFTDLWAATYEPVRRYALRLLHQPDVAADVVAEAYLATFRALRNGAGPTDRLLPYVFVAVRRLAQRDLERRSRQVSFDDWYGPGVAAWTASEPLDAGADDAAVEAFHALNERHQLVLRLIVLEGRNIDEVATTLGMSANATSALAYRARRALRTRYEAGLAENGPGHERHEP
jgi:RNA polymerase sigma factor (sigma-70 family)